MDIHLSEDLEELVQRKVKSGRYRSVQEVISIALWTLDERDQDLDSRATAFKEEIEQRLASGPATPMDFSALKSSLRAEAAARRTERR